MNKIQAERIRHVVMCTWFKYDNISESMGRRIENKVIKMLEHDNADRNSNNIKDITISIIEKL